MACEGSRQMKEQEVSMLLTKQECRWVRARLPLWVGDGGLEQSDVAVTGGDLSAQDHQRVARHLAVCKGCCQQQAALERAFGAIMAASAESPVDRAAPSLWPVLEQRINGRGGAAPEPQSNLASGVRGRPLFSLTGLRHVRPGFSSFLVGGAIASLVVSFVSGVIAHRQWLDAQSTIHGNAAPLVRVDASTATDLAQAADADPDDDGESSVKQLAAADPLPVSETTASVAGSPAAKPAVHARVADDGEHNTIGAPDPRESKPIY